MWDQAYRKLITFETLWKPETDPLPIVLPVVQSEVAKQAGHPVVIDTVAGLDPANYQNFAITNDGVIFFFSQGGLLPEAAGATQVLGTAVGDRPTARLGTGPVGPVVAGHLRRSGSPPAGNHRPSNTVPRIAMSPR